MSSDGVRIYHIRNVAGPHKGEVFEKGGLTVAVRIDADLVLAAIGVCGHKHTFNRKQGRKVATGRVETLRKRRSVKFAQIFDIGRFGDDDEFERALMIAHILVTESRLKGRQRKTALNSIECTRMQREFMVQMTGDPNGKVTHNYRYDTKLAASSTVNFNVAGAQTGRYPSDKPNQP